MPATSLKHRNALRREKSPLKKNAFIYDISKREKKRRRGGKKEAHGNKLRDQPLCQEIRPRIRGFDCLPKEGNIRKIQYLPARISCKHDPPTVWQPSESTLLRRRQPSHSRGPKNQTADRRIYYLRTICHLRVAFEWPFVCL